MAKPPYKRPVPLPELRRDTYPARDRVDVGEVHATARVSTLQDQIGRGIPFERLVALAQASWNLDRNQAIEEVRAAYHALQDGRTDTESRRFAKTQIRAMYFNLYARAQDSDHPTSLMAQKNILDSLVALDRLHQPDVDESTMQHRPDLAMLGYESPDDVRAAIENILAEAKQLEPPQDAELVDTEPPEPLPE